MEYPMDWQPTVQENESRDVTIQRIHDQINELWETHKPINDPTRAQNQMVLWTYLIKEHWWRLMLLPSDHKEACAAFDKHQIKSRVDYYDQSPGFEHGMIDAYDHYLNSNSVKMTDLLTAKEYLQMFQMVTKYSNTAPLTQNRYHWRGTEGVVTFPAPRYLPDDILETTIQVDGKEVYLVKSFSKPRAELGLVKHTSLGSSGYRWHSAEYGQHLAGVVSSIFNKFRTEVQHPQSGMDRLRSIAKLIRDLHVLHCFSDGNGRVNVYLLLPRLLLEYGFGLPLGGENRHSLDPRAMNDMFSGGYSVEQVARFLWLAQDFGEKEKNYNKTSIKTYPPDY